MSKKLSFIGVLCISLIAMWAIQANAWFIPSPPGVSGWGWGSYTITVDFAGGGPIDPVTGFPKDLNTSLDVEIQMFEAYLVLKNPQFRKGIEKLVLVGVGGSVPVHITHPLTTAYPNDRGHFSIDVEAPFSVDECCNDSDFEVACKSLDDDPGTAFLLYWNIIDNANQFNDVVKNNWYPTELRIIVARVGAALEGKHAQGDPAQVFVATDEDPRATVWPDPSDLESEVIYVIRLEGEPFAFNDFNSTLAGATLKVKARKGVLSNDFDREGDPLEVVAVGATEGDIHTSSVGEPVPTANSGTVTLDADGSFTYTPPDDFTGDDSFTYKNGEINGVNESNVATVNIVIY